jgi:hypothetical protein
MFFTRRKEAPALAPERIRGMRISLNTPVLRAEELPVAPARAVLLLYEREDGSLAIELGVRSLKSGRVVHFEPETDLPPESNGLDAAMAFGEGMGFLFDDDELEQGDGERAFAMWNDLVGAPEELALALTSLEPDDGEELLLVEEVPEPDVPIELASKPESAAPPNTDLLTSLVEDALGGPAPGSEALPTPPEGPALSVEASALTKFRTAPGTAPAAMPEEAALDAEAIASDGEAGLPAAAPVAEEAVEAAPRTRKRRRAALGRLRLVKKRKPGSDDDRRRFLARLLSSF